MALRIQGEGSVEMRGPHSCRVEFQVFDTITGETKRRRKTFRVDGATKKERERCRREYRKELEGGIRSEADSVTVGQLANRWLDQRRKSPDIQASTVRKDEGRVAVIVSRLGGAKLGDIDTLTIEDFCNALVRGEGGSRALSGTYVSGIMSALRQMLDDAERYGLIPKNPARCAKLPKKDTSETASLSLGQMESLARELIALEPKPSVVAFLLALTTGLRRGELCGLRWCDVDLSKESSRLSVAHSLSSLGCELKEPKTAKSYRSIPLAPEVRDYLACWKNKQGAQLQKIGISQATHFVVCSPGAPYMHPENLAKAWRRFASKRGVGGVTLHGLRHSFCTWLAACHVPLNQASYYMGHADIQTTANVYTHFDEEVSRRDESQFLAAMKKLNSNGTTDGGSNSAALPSRSASSPDFPQEGPEQRKSIPSCSKIGLSNREDAYRNKWCGREDLNLHGVAPIRT